MSVPKNDMPKIDDLPKGNKVKVAPVITTEEAKVIMISGAAGDILAQHKVNGNGLLLVKKGTIRFSIGEENLTFTAGEGHSIPSEVVHAVTCITYAEFFVIIPVRSKIKFER
jgi:quercetin dioxygenase-like cupin family protein